MKRITTLLLAAAAAIALPAAAQELSYANSQPLTLPADIFFGIGTQAEAHAGQLKGRGSWWLLLPRGLAAR